MPSLGPSQLINQAFYAFSLPAQTPTIALPTKPANSTPNPFTLPIKPKTEEAESNIHKGKKRAALDDQEGAFGDDRAKRERTGKSASMYR
jgi:hypothetical protein